MDIDPDVSIVVPTHNRCAGLYRLLCALSEQSFPRSRFEVVVVDDGSTDATADVLRTTTVPYALRSLSQSNSGPSVARNHGVQQARGRLILFLDDDVVPVPGLISAHVEAHGEANDVVVTGPMLAPPDSFPQPVWDRWDAAKLDEQYRAMLAGVYPCTQRQFFTANASLHREMFLKSGGFDPTFLRAEDMELAWRLRGGGARFVFEPRAEVVHFAARRFASWRKNAYDYGRYDVVMEQQKGIPILQLACLEFHRRRGPNRWLARLCVGRGRLSAIAIVGLVVAVRVASKLGAHRIASFALSSIFNVRYWQGVSDELGSPERLWKAVAAKSVLEPTTALRRPGL
jgi:glycosyltransferase involved in cell wall biosynthesis